MGLSDDEINLVVCQADATHRRQSEAAILPFGDGRLLLAYSDFYGGRWEDGTPAQIAARWSYDNGASWSQPYVLQENIGRLNVMVPSLLRLPSGRVLLAFLRKDSEPEQAGRSGLLHVMLKYSDDECRTWSRPVPVTEGDGYWCGTNDRLFQLSGGRLLYPLERHPGECHVWLSDDEGATWRRSRTSVLPPEGKNYAEPAVVELNDGTVAMFIRNDTGFLHMAISRDGGDSWELHNQWGPTSPFAPCMVRRIPQTSDLLLIWNNHANNRVNLTAAISRDNGATWTNFRILEEQETWPTSRSHAYPSLAFCGRYAHMTYWEFQKHEGDRFCHLIYRRLPVSWFYENPARRAPVWPLEIAPAAPPTVFDGQRRP